MFSGVRFLGFDVFGTVVDWRTSVAREVEPFLKKHGVVVDPFGFADAWRALYQSAMQRVRSGERSWVTLDVLNRENLKTVLSRQGVASGAIAEDELTELTAVWERLVPWPDSVEGLTRLKTRFTIGALSNGHIAGMTNLARFGGLPWDIITGAEVAHTYKPMPQVYLKSAEAAGVKPEECAMVAAHNSDLEAARALGFRTAFVRRSHEHGPNQSTDLAASDAWDVLVESMTELASALGV